MLELNHPSNRVSHVVALALTLLSSASLAHCDSSDPLPDRDAAVLDSGNNNPAPDGSDHPADANRTDSSDPSDISTRGDAPIPPKADAPCACTLPPDGSTTVFTSLECFCASFRCPDYFTALTTCSPYLYESRIIYESCNLEVISVRGSFDPGINLTYDRTTHELVGAAAGTEGTPYRCADGGVWSFRAGVRVPADCTWKQQDLCLDGG